MPSAPWTLLLPWLQPYEPYRRDAVNPTGRVALIAAARRYNDCDSVGRRAHYLPDSHRVCFTVTSCQVPVASSSIRSNRDLYSN